MPAQSSLLFLPTELYEAILNQVDPPDLQKATLALALAIPRSPVPVHPLYRHIRVTSRGQVPKLWNRLELSRKVDAEEWGARAWIRTFESATFDVDADILYNAIYLLPRIRYLHLNIGTTFAPEHLDDLFRTPKNDLRCLSLRFRPYVVKATYYQFLKGQYSDILVEHMTRWPANPSLTHLSMAQDPLPASSFDPATSFAQPIVFFSLEVFRPFSRSPVARHITHLRLRVPSRLVVAQLLEPGSFPALRALDVSSTALGNPERALPLLLARHTKLEHLVLDDCVLSRETFRDLARALALAGQIRSRTREKKVNEWLEGIHARSVAAAAAAAASNDGNGTEGASGGSPAPIAQAQAQAQASAANQRRARQGRRGVAAAPFSIRATPVTTQHNQAHASSSSASSAAPLPVLSASAAAAVPKKIKVRILPPLPSLRTFSTRLFPAPDASQAAQWRTDFDAGWRGGTEVLLGARARLHTTAASSSTTLHVRVMRFADGADLLRSEEELDGLVDVSAEELEVWNAQASDPVVCFGKIRKGRASKLNKEQDGNDSDNDLWREDPSPLPSDSSDEDDGSEAEGTVRPPAPAPALLPKAGAKKYSVRDDGHVQGCGHEVLHNCWNIYQRYLDDV